MLVPYTYIAGFGRQGKPSLQRYDRMVSLSQCVPLSARVCTVLEKPGELYRTIHTHAACLSDTQLQPAARNLPGFLARTDYEEPIDPNNSNYAELTPEGLNFFQRMTSESVLSKSFRLFQSGFAEFRLDWTDIFDLEGLLKGFEFEDTRKKLLVDIGGSRKLPFLSPLLYVPPVRGPCLAVIVAAEGALQ